MGNFRWSLKSLVYQGTEPPIPKYLRWTGKVRNRNLSKADTAQIIQDIWNQKIVSDTEVFTKHNIVITCLQSKEKILISGSL